MTHQSANKTTQSCAAAARFVSIKNSIKWHAATLQNAQDIRKHGVADTTDMLRLHGKAPLARILKELQPGAGAVWPCGMSARWRPHGDVSAAMPSGEPLGLNGYASVAAPAASQYLRRCTAVLIHNSKLTAQ